MRKNFMEKLSRKRLLITGLGVGILVLGLIAFSPLVSMAKGSNTVAATSDDLHPFTVTSPNFREDGPLPRTAEFGGGNGCTGKNIAPTLNWRGVPAGTMGFAMTMNDVDAPVAGGFHHWIVYNIPAQVRSINGHNNFTGGTNSFGQTVYDGPCPPPTGQIHHYIFTVYALSVPSIQGQGLTFEALLQAISKDVVGATSTIGTFKRVPADS
ncbi:MAG TPA: YbhB/YbcL family Raf kinase inhibitor-like protein [Ktedonobacteraceae bacterium]|nr:YbhB/YbcL family Raf kinase inhibitor-like protein [Ktedonobacteraceae bacterium]